MSHLSQLRSFRKIASQAVAHYPLSNVRLDYFSFTENVVYKITANEGKFILRIHAPSFRSQAAITEELNLLTLLSESGGFEVQKPLQTTNQDIVLKLDNKIISILTWQDGRKKRASIGDKHIDILGHYMAKLHQFTARNRHKINMQYRDYWTPENLIGDQPILGAFEGLETIRGFNRDIFEASRRKTLQRITQHSHDNPHLQAIIHADLHFSNIIWRGDTLLPIDFDDCGIGSFLHDLSIPIISLQGDKSHHHRDILLNAYCQIQNLNQNDLDIIDDYILARHITMQGWLYSRSSHPKIKNYQARSMQTTMDILKASL